MTRRTRQLSAGTQRSRGKRHVLSDRQTDRQTDREDRQRTDSIGRTVFRRPFVKRFALCYRSVVCLSVCDVRALWPNGWTDQDETWHAGRPRPWPHCVRWGPRSPSQKGGGAPKFSAHVYCDQTARWMKVVLGMEVGLIPGDFVLDGDPAPLPKKGAEPPKIFGPCLLRVQTGTT